VTFNFAAVQDTGLSSGTPDTGTFAAQAQAFSTITGSLTYDPATPADTVIDTSSGQRAYYSTGSLTLDQLMVPAGWDYEIQVVNTVSTISSVETYVTNIFIRAASVDLSEGSPVTGTDDYDDFLFRLNFREPFTGQPIDPSLPATIDLAAANNYSIFFRDRNDGPDALVQYRFTEFAQLIDTPENEVPLPAAALLFPAGFIALRRMNRKTT
jgi:hypothetical protein